MRLQFLAAVAVFVLLAPPTISDAAEPGQGGDIIGAITRHIAAEDGSLVELEQRHRVGFIYLAFGTYVIHGTNKPAGVGRYVSRGCIRMYEADVQELYEQVHIETPVSIVYQSVKVGWSDGALYIEVHPNRDQADEIEATGTFTAASELGVEQRILDKVGDAERVDWESVGRALRERRGLPVRITFDD